jgi:hypothetical protein
MKKLAFIFVLVILIPLAAAAQGNAFNFQGRLNDGTNPANGRYDLQFSLFNLVQGGAQIGSTIARPNTILINGVFSVTLDFGAAAFNNPNSIFIEISVKPANSPNAYTILGPRQQLTVVPFSVRAANATNADNATTAQTAVNATNAGNSNTLNGLNSTDFIKNQTTPQPNSSFNISGNGFINGNLNLVGNTFQNRDKGGFVKAMVYVDQFGVLVRCYNGVTVSSAADCGITVIPPGSGFPGKYRIDFPFQVNDRFVAVTPGTASVNIVASFAFEAANRVTVYTNITDVDHGVSWTDDDFMLIVY